MPAKLIGETEGFLGQELLLTDGEEWVIGRDPEECQIVVSDPATSRRHLICRATPQGYVIENFSETNPVLVNNQQVSAATLLKEGDLLQIGQGLWRFTIFEGGNAEKSEAALLEEQSNGVFQTDIQQKTIDEEKVHETTMNDAFAEITEEEVALPEDDEQASLYNEQEVISGAEKAIGAKTSVVEKASLSEEASVVQEENSEEESHSNSHDDGEEYAYHSGEESSQPDHSVVEVAADATHEEQEELSQAGLPEVEEESFFDEEVVPGDLPAFHQMDLELTESGRWLLKVVSGPNNGAEFSLRPGTTYLIGTDPNICDIVFHDTSVSRQHARLTVSAEEILTIEDLNSRNGTLVDAESLTARHVLEPNLLVTLGSTSFVIIDREGQMQTIISPFLPSIVKLLQQKQANAIELAEAAEQQKLAHAEALAAATAAAAAAAAAAAVPPAGTAAQQNPGEVLAAPHKEPRMAMILLTAIVVGVVAVAGMAVTSLFNSSDSVIVTKRDVTQNIDKILAKFPAVRGSFNKNTGKLLLVGHVLTSVDLHQLLYDLQELPEVSVDSKAVVVDEYVWQESNQILARTPTWRGITIHAAAPGKFVLSGYLQTREQADKLYDYISSNFPYLDLLDKQVVIEEDVVSSVSSALRKHGFLDIKVQMQDGDLSLTGGVPQARRNEFQELMNGFQKIPGVRDVKNMAFNLAPEQSMVDVSDRYEVTGFSQAGGKLSVVIGKRALYEGDILDGMRIEKISPSTVLLDKDGVKYRINYSS